jgi:hypothetical protein
MDGLASIGQVLAGILQLMVFLSSLLFRGLVWIIALVANLFGWTLGQRFVNRLTLATAVLLSAYLGLGYILITQQSVSEWFVVTFYNAIVLYPVIILTGIVWVGYFGAPNENEIDKNGLPSSGGADAYNLYYMAVLAPLLMIICAIYFIGAKSDFYKNLRQIAKTEACVERREETGSNLKKLAQKFGIGEELSETIGENLTKRCK